jgi:LPXTG-motif cell wall-anchored protein
MTALPSNQPASGEHLQVNFALLGAVLFSLAFWLLVFFLVKGLVR